MFASLWIDENYESGILLMSVSVAFVSKVKQDNWFYFESPLYPVLAIVHHLLLQKYSFYLCDPIVFF